MVDRSSLKPMTYTGGLEIGDRLVRLYGSLGPDGQRTAFTGTTRVSSPQGPRGRRFKPRRSDDVECS